MDERRELPRWEIKEEAKVWMHQTQSFAHGIIEDLHLKGMCLSFNKNLFQQKTVNLAFTLGEGFDLIKIEAQVPWAKEQEGRYVYGLSFNKIADPDKEKISAHINTHCADQFKKKWWGPQWRDLGEC